MDVALDPPALGVLRRYQPLARGPEFLDQPGIAEHQAGLSGKIADELVLGGGQRAARRHPHGQGAEKLALMQDGHGAIRAVDQGQSAGRRDRENGRRRCLLRPAASAVQLGPQGQPYLRCLRASALGQDLGHPARNFLRRVGIGHPAGEFSQHLIGRGAPSVHNAVREVLDPLAERLEGHRDHGRGHGGEG